MVTRGRAALPLQVADEFPHARGVVLQAEGGAIIEKILEMVGVLPAQDGLGLVTARFELVTDLVPPHLRGVRFGHGVRGGALVPVGETGEGDGYGSEEQATWGH